MSDYKYKKENVCAVIVSYNPDNLLLDNLNALIDQVSKCVVIDNGSTKKDFVDKIKMMKNVDLIELFQNKGIAYALNKGLEYCKKNNYQLILTMDQDTILCGDAVEKLLIAMCKYRSDSVGFNWDGRLKHDKKQSYLITSGNLVIVNAATNVGGFDEKLFIDSVDFDFSLRLKDAGYLLVKVCDAKGIHHLGTKTDKGLTSHSADRYFYIYRNHFYLTRKYKWKHPIFLLKKNIALLIDLALILLWGNEKKEKFFMLKKSFQESKSL